MTGITGKVDVGVTRPTYITIEIPAHTGIEEQVRFFRELTQASALNGVGFEIDGTGVGAAFVASLNSYTIDALPQGLYVGANRYDTDNEHVLSLWTESGVTHDVRWPKEGA